PDEDYYFNDDHAEVRAKFLAHVQRISALAGLGEKSGITDAEVAAKVMAFETALARHHWDRVACRDAEKTYNKYSVSQLRDLGPEFDFDSYLGLLTAEAADLNHLVVSQPSFVTGMAKVCAETDIETIKTWLRFVVVSDTAALLSDGFVEEHVGLTCRRLAGAPAQTGSAHVSTPVPLVRDRRPSGLGPRGRPPSSTSWSPSPRSSRAWRRCRPRPTSRPSRPGCASSSSPTPPRCCPMSSSRRTSISSPARSRAHRLCGSGGSAGSGSSRAASARRWANSTSPPSSRHRPRPRSTTSWTCSSRPTTSRSANSTG